MTITLAFVGKANYYGTRVVQNKKCCVLQENIVSKLLTLYDQEQLINMLLTKSVNCLDKQSSFSIAPAAQYCSVAHERVNYSHTSVYVLLW